MYIRDKYGSIIGRIMESNDGVTRIYDSIGSYAGQYDSSSNRTYDKYGSYYGDGNLLTMLLGRD